jgi:hypothetical protein
MCHPSNCNVDTVSEDASDLIFYDGAAKHKEGYRAQPCWFRDDFMQMPETANTPIADSDANFLINAISGTQLPIEMAHLENKGMFFNSPIFAYTANIAYPNPPTVSSALALQRRRNVLIYVTYKEDSNIYPSEAIPHVVNGEEVPERRLQHTDFHIIDSVLHIGNGVVSDKNWGPEMRPKHGTGIPYTRLLRIL